jgi:hypothetical protein
VCAESEFRPIGTSLFLWYCFLMLASATLKGALFVRVQRQPYPYTRLA